MKNANTQWEGEAGWEGRKAEDEEEREIYFAQAGDMLLDCRENINTSNKIYFHCVIWMFF